MESQKQCAYPRPQLEREKWLCLDGVWKFRFDDQRDIKQPKDIRDWPLEILVPFPPESTRSGIGDRGFHKACWYQREFQMKRGKGRVILHLGAVDYAASVWVNDRMVAFHEGGHTPFWTDITSVLKRTRSSAPTFFITRAKYRCSSSRSSKCLPQSFFANEKEYRWLGVSTPAPG